MFDPFYPLPAWSAKSIGWPMPLSLVFWGGQLGTTMPCPGVTAGTISMLYSFRSNRARAVQEKARESLILCLGSAKCRLGRIPSVVRDGIAATGLSCLGSTGHRDPGWNCSVSSVSIERRTISIGWWVRCKVLVILGCSVSCRFLVWIRFLFALANQWLVAT